MCEAAKLLSEAEKAKAQGDKKKVKEILAKLASS